jgi:hypothetical protein
VTEYPLAAILALLITYAYLHDKSYLVLVDTGTWEFTPPESAKSWTALFLGFIVAVIMANVLGWTLDWIFAGLSRLFSAAGFFAGSFDKSPLVFSASFLIFSLIGFLWLWFRAGRKIRHVSVLQILAASLVVLFCSYLSTSLITSFTKASNDSPAAAAP